MKDRYTIGLDFGTLSGRVVLVRLSDGEVLASASRDYPHGVIDRSHNAFGLELGEGWALQYPNDYVEVMGETVASVLKESQVSKEQVVGIGVDFTSCTMLPIDEKGEPLCNQEKYRKCRNAYAKLWKHHGAQHFADRINDYLEEQHLEKTPRFGGRISSELMIPKIMETREENEEIYQSAHAFLEAGDWITRILTDSSARSISFAGYKCWYDEEGYPEEEFFEALDPRLKDVIRKLGTDIRPVYHPVGYLNQKWADCLGLQAGIPVAPAIIDSHAGVPGCGISGRKQIMLVLGTSSVMIGFGEEKYSGLGIYGNVKDAIVPGFYGYESGLACVGDLFSWFVENQVPYKYYKEAEERKLSIHDLLSEKAGKLKAGESGLLILDWWNGNKTPYVDSSLKGAIFGLTLSSKPEEIYRALIEATAFGTRRILELYEQQGVRVEEIICSGGISYKNPLLMQIYANVLGKPLRVAESDQAAALGSAIYAAVCAGAYERYEDAVERMARVREMRYEVNENEKKVYDGLYERYKELGERMVR